jgi:molecular chaperone GrpE
MSGFSDNEASTVRPGGASSGGPADAGQRPADAGQRPADAHSESAAHGPPSSQRESASDVARDDENEGATDWTESMEPAAETAERFPPEVGREADEDSGDGDQAEASDPLSEALAQRDEFRDALVRLQADFENYKKRMLKQQTEYLERAAGQLVDKLLPVLDTADLALAHGGGEDVKQVTSALMGALEKEGLERIAGEGSPFDPTLHDAVVHEPADEDGEQTVTEVLRAGYKWKGRVLRPAMVKVRG